MLPPITDRAAFQAEIDALRVREKEHTRAGDAIAVGHRRGTPPVPRQRPPDRPVAAAGGRLLGRPGYAGLESEHELESLVDSLLLVRRQASGVCLQALEVDGAKLLDEHACRLAVEDDLRSERGRCGAS